MQLQNDHKKSINQTTKLMQSTAAAEPDRTYEIEKEATPTGRESDRNDWECRR